MSSEREWKGRESCQGGEIGFDGYLLDNYLPVGAGGKRVVLRSLVLVTGKIEGFEGLGREVILFCAVDQQT